MANRGEIALRTVRACKERGIAAVTLHSEVDRFVLHVKRASHSHCLIKKPLVAYLNGRRIIECAKMAGCEAIHPGYGFYLIMPNLPRIATRRESFLSAPLLQ